MTNGQIKQAMDRLNNRPRKTRGNMSPNELFWGSKLIYLLHNLLQLLLDPPSINNR